MGVDFVVGVDDGATAVDLEIDISIALYQPLFPTREEVLESARVQERSEEDPDGENPDDSPPATNLPITEAWIRTDVSTGALRLRVPVSGEHVGAEIDQDLDRIVGVAVREHFARADAARPFRSGGRTVPRSALESDEDYWRSINSRVDSAWAPQVPTIGVEAFCEPLPNGDLLLSVSILNRTMPRENDRLQDLAAYDAHINVQICSGSLKPQRFRLAPADYRYRDLTGVAGHGRGCVAVQTASGGIASETLPLHVQRVVQHRTDHIPRLTWALLAEDPDHILRDVDDAMRAYLREWDSFLRALGPDQDDVKAASGRDRSAFREEAERFSRGRALLGEDPELRRAFQLANAVFQRAGAARGHSAWRPFQLVYIVSYLASLAARRHPDRGELAAELEHAEVLWFPTGGGKTEAYLGLITVALFYDRLRGKDRGITSVLRFPLRMLSAQQLERILKILVVAETVRSEAALPGAAFELGYLVGGSNTPTLLRYGSDSLPWWPGMSQAHRMSEADRQRHRLIASCPFCMTYASVRLKPDPQAQRLLHICSACERWLPLHITDEEVHRYQPAVIVSTIDKLTGFAHYGEFTAFNHGPARRCPDHGYFSFGKCLAEGCVRTRSQTEIVDRWTDPVPTLVVQDELHLVAEELGAFASHFESLLASLQRAGPSGLPSKILAASATIEGYGDQVRQVYGRYPRRFPSPGFARDRSFYIEETVDIRRAFLGLMPTGPGTSRVEVAGRVQAEMVRAVQDLQDNPIPLRAPLRRVLGRTVHDDEILEWLFDYEVSLAYVNRRRDGASITDDLRDLSQRLENDGRDALSHELFTGDVPIAELASAIDRVERGTAVIPRHQRLRALVGTSVLSHGVDLERLNLEVMTGMPPTVADYIQASSRAGRTHAGLVVTIFDHFSLREASMFSHFISTHVFLERLVEPVPVNRYARLAAKRTVPAIIMALLWDLARDPSLGAPAEGIRNTRQFRPWWNRRATDLELRVQDGLGRALSSAVAAVADPELEARLIEWVEERWRSHEKPSMLVFGSRLTKDLFEETVLTSLRDVDEPAMFTTDSRHIHAFQSLS